MFLRLNNIGLVKDSEINIDGLTVITGDNNSGKTTVGKVIYSLVDATSQIGGKARRDKLNYIRRGLQRIADELRLFRMYFSRKEAATENDKCNNEYEELWSLFGKNLIYKVGLSEYIDYIHELCNELKVFDPDKELDSKSSDFRDEMEEQRVQGIEMLEKLLLDLDKDPDLMEYTIESINQTLNKEFAGQIQPVAFSVDESTISMGNSGKLYYNIRIKNNKVISKEGSFRTGGPKSVFLIDDPFILDRINKTSNIGARIYFTPDEEPIEIDTTIIDPSIIQTHEKKLERVLKEGPEASVFEQIIRNESIKTIREMVNEIVPGRIDQSGRRGLLVRGDVKLDLYNLATGSKLFAIIKMLIERNLIQPDTILIFDEPESHLHPKWQNVFAEIIVLLVKIAGVKVVLTTHSSNFMLAVDAYIRKHDIVERSDFYLTEKYHDGTVGYMCVNDDKELIYESFLSSFSEVKELRDMYIRSEKND